MGGVEFRMDGFFDQGCGETFREASTFIEYRPAIFTVRTEWRSSNDSNRRSEIFAPSSPLCIAWLLLVCDISCDVANIPGNSSGYAGRTGNRT